MLKGYRRQLTIGIGLLISAAAIWYFVDHLGGHWDELGEAFLGADYVYLVPSVGLIGLMYALRVLRWRLFLKPVADVPASAIASATLIGFMSTCVLPLRPGEVIRPYVLHKKTGVSFGHAAGTAVGLERVFDLIGVAFLVVLALALMPTLAAAEAAGGNGSPDGASVYLEQIREKGPWFIGLALAGLVALTAVAFAPELVLRIGGFFLRVFPAGLREKLMGFLESVTHSMQFLRDPARVAVALALTLAAWGCFPLSTLMVARWANLGLPLVGALLVQVIVTAAVAAPQAPGFLGVFHGAAMFGVWLFGVPEGSAGAFAIMLWTVNVVPITVVGLGVLWYEGLSLTGLAQQSEAAAAHAEAV